MSKLTIKQQRFADEYIISGNKYQSAITAGYSKNYAKAQSSKLLENVGIKSYIDERLEQIKSEKVADQQEILEYLTSVVRGEQTEQTLIGEGMGEQKITDIELSGTQRIKAAELLGKRYAMWTDKQDISGSLGMVQIFDDIPKGDSNGDD
ncbi:terminase small subunit [Marinilactibacillus psychrotolerans]|uniref:terminase small subunit n=1 Tax=Marinilactibacillus psychrotolerans TaxID=191770 RepID=UPI00388B6EC2